MAESRYAREPWLHLVALVALFALGCAHGAGRQAGHAAVEELGEQAVAADPNQPSALAERTARGAVRGGLDELTKPESLERLASVFRSGTAAAFEGATRGEGRGVGGSGAAAFESPASQLSEVAAQSFAQALSRELERQIGPGGEGPLGKLIGSASEQAAHRAVRGAKQELNSLFPECSGPDRKACLRAQISELGYALSSGATEGVRDSVGALPLLLTFGAGLLTAAVLAWARSLYRGRHRAPA